MGLRPCFQCHITQTNLTIGNPDCILPMGLGGLRGGGRGGAGGRRRVSDYGKPDRIKGIRHVFTPPVYFLVLGLSSPVLHCLPQCAVDMLALLPESPRIGG
jgi:hypothetical protein